MWCPERHRLPLENEIASCPRYAATTMPADIRPYLAELLWALQQICRQMSRQRGLLVFVWAGLLALHMCLQSAPHICPLSVTPAVMLLQHTNLGCNQACNASLASEQIGFCR